MTVCYQFWWPFATRRRIELQFHTAPGSKRSSKLHKMYQSRCTAKNSWWRAERLPETCRVVIPTKLGFSAFVGFIHKESVTMHGHTIIKLNFILSADGLICHKLEILSLNISFLMSNVFWVHGKGAMGDNRIRLFSFEDTKFLQNISLSV